MESSRQSVGQVPQTYVHLHKIYYMHVYYSSGRTDGRTTRCCCYWS